MKSNAGDRAPVGGQLAHHFAISHIPEKEPAVGSACGNESLAGAHSQRANRRRGTLERPYLLPIIKIREEDDLVCACRGHQPAIG